MKWSIWIDPNKIIEEDYPAGWSHDDVYRAASNRWGGKVSTVSPAPIGGDNSNSSSRSNTNSSSGGSGIGLGGLIILGGLVALISVFDGGEDTKTYEYFEPDTTVELKRVKQEDFTWDPLSPPSVNYEEPFSPPPVNYEAPFFAQDGIQEEVIDDLGQNWDN